ncbi:hypothetical protein ACG1BZ_20885 [Microbulbifer sp. CNSA002]|uniref:hypothetical protein n=1 Tax=unclassified Microbulbifer TaxID=2619833 RepID=UPI0039B3FE87
MKFSKRQVTFLSLALLSGFVAWYALGAASSCAHFDIKDFCKGVFTVAQDEMVLSEKLNCFRLVELSSSLCDYTFKLGIGALALGISTLIISIRELIYSNVVDNWNIENS